jgi:cytochrome P450
MPAAVLGHRARIADIAVELLDARVPDGLLEISEDIARPLLTRLMAEIVGIPVPEREAFHRLAHEAMDVGTLGTPDWSSAMLSASCEAHGAIEQMVHRLLADPAEVPVDSVLGESIRRHGAPGALNPAEIATNLRSLYTAGLHTTTPLIAGVAYFLFAEPDVIEAVRADRNTVATLVRETLRYASPAVEVNIRRAVRDTHIGNHCVRAGEFVRTVVLRACRDATRFSDPDRFDLHRGREGKLLAFGTGPHVCLGKHLAIAVAEEICAVLARPRYAARLDAPYPRYVRRGAVPVMWGPEWVHIRIGPAAEGANG